MNFADRAHDDVVRSFISGWMDESPEHERWFLYDTHSEMELNRWAVDLRLIAYRLPYTLTKAKEFYRTGAFQTWSLG